MADYSSTGIWDENGYNVALDDLPVDNELRKRIVSWTNEYEKCEDYLPADQRSRVFDVYGFTEEGLSIAKSIKTQLPDWTVIYFDESKLAHGLREEFGPAFEYEVTI